ncbi:hypothetical protein [Sulfitobacter sp. S190]|uniref:hypothetical protein n=1 Tax=Sulfitobacter sp. S190 TaxID=2867022 RepID=UPI0021A35538|nr:hypothetical protein [Sulfitobacter sp. S190]UWR22974.1 hypothetical protein K3756_02950 [Sulfitobacter sp. S190]
MEIGILAALLGVGLLTVLGSDSDDHSEDDTEETVAPDPEVGEPPVNVGTDGDDRVFIQDDNNIPNATLGDGDDRGFAFVTEGSTLSGGLGDDTLDGGTRSTLLGDEGDDRLAISDFNRSFEGQTNYDSAAFGGEGNDSLFSDRGFTEEGTVSLFGEAGNDDITVDNDAGFIERGGITKVLSGGEGDDTFRVNLLFPDADPDAADPEPHTTDDTNVFITDFTPGTETLVVTAGGIGGSAAPPFETAELTRDADGLTTLTLTFAAVGTAPPAVTTIGLGFADGITLDDIILPGET